MARSTKRAHRPVTIACRGCGNAEAFGPLLRVVSLYDVALPLSVVWCRRCGLCFINPQYQAGAYADYYRDDYYDEGRNASIERIHEGTRGTRRAFAPWFGRFVQTLPPGGRYLDAGAGTGQWLDALAEAHPGIERSRIHALEPSDVSAEFILRRHPGIGVQRRTLEENEYPGRFFDCVLCSALIEHLTDPLSGLFHLNRILVPGGRLMLLTPSLDEHAFARGPANFFKFVHTFYYTKETLASLLHKAGFEAQTLEVHYDPSFTWYGMIVAIARKAADRAPGALQAHRAATPEDAANAARVDAMLSALERRVGEFRRRFYGMYFKRRLKAAVLGMLGRG